MFSNFYHSTLRNTVIAFGTLFNDLYVSRKNSAGAEVEKIRVPLTYSSKEKFYYRMQRDLEYNDQPHLQMTLPRMGFEITGYSYDNVRKQNTMHKRITKKADNTNKLSFHYMPVPYLIDFELYILVRHTDDGLQILEQILPYFTPHFTITIKPKILNDTLEKQDIPITLQSVSTEENYEGGFDEGKTTIHTLSFQAKINIYGPVRENGVIKQSEVNILDLDADPNLQDFKAEILARPAIFEKDTDGDYVLDTDGKRIEAVDYTTIEVDDDYEILVNVQEWPEDDDSTDWEDVN